MKKPVISVVMPVYNSELYLEEAIRSILEQEFTEFELIIIDDGSTDNSFHVIKSFADPRIKLIQNKYNIGTFPSRNRGHDLAQGEYICVMDSDDIALPCRLATQFDYMNANPDVGLSGSRIIIGSNRQQEVQFESDYELHKVRLLQNSTFCHPTLILRSSMFREKQLYYNEDYLFAGDYDLIVRASQTFSITNIEKPLLYYRYHHEQITSRHGEAQAFFARHIMRCYFSVLGLYPTNEEMDVYFRFMRTPFLTNDEMYNCAEMLSNANKKTLYLNQRYLDAFLDERVRKITENKSRYDEIKKRSSDQQSFFCNRMTRSYFRK